MIRWFEQLYRDDFVRNNPRSCMKIVKSKKIYKKRVTVIALASNPENLFDIIRSRELSFGYYKKKDLYILGLAKNRKSAIRLLKELVNDVWYQDEFAPRRYFSTDRFVTGQALVKQWKRGKK